MRFDFFTSSLSEMREYRSGMDYWYYLRHYLRQPGATGKAELIHQNEKTFYNDHFRSTNLIYPREPGGLANVEDVFGIILPDDFIEFYDHWSQALLVLREAFWIMPSKEIIDVNRMWRGFPHDQYGCNLVRFARCFGNRGQHFALRRKNPAAEWKVAMIDDSDFHVDDEEAGSDQQDCRVTDPSFTAWLKRMLETDGTPWFPGVEEECKTLRVG